MFFIFALLGLVVLVLGQRYFGLALGALAWVWAMNLLGHPLEGLGEGAVLIIAFIIAIGAGLAARLRRSVGSQLGGLLSGSLAASLVVELAGAQLGGLFWPVIAVGAVVGFLVMRMWPTRGSIVLFSICGAGILPLSFELQKQDSLTGWALFLALIPAGLFIQSRVLKAPGTASTPYAA